MTFTIHTTSADKYLISEIDHHCMSFHKFNQSMHQSIIDNKPVIKSKLHVHPPNTPVVSVPWYMQTGPQKRIKS